MRQTEKKYMPVPEAAAYLGRKPDWLYRCDPSTGEPYRGIPRYEVGGRIFFRAEDLDEYMSYFRVVPGSYAQTEKPGRRKGRMRWRSAV